MNKLNDLGGGMYSFKCPGCGDEHRITTQSRNAWGARWSFNGNTDAPTFSPSLHFKSGHFVPGEEKKVCGWCKDYPDLKVCYCCHSFVRDGKIQFLNDCSHHLAGHTVDLPATELGQLNKGNDTD